MYVGGLVDYKMWLCTQGEKVAKFEVVVVVVVVVVFVVVFVVVVVVVFVHTREESGKV